MMYTEVRFILKSIEVRTVEMFVEQIFLFQPFCACIEKFPVTKPILVQLVPYNGSISLLFSLPIVFATARLEF
jgi:hypothetical protein